MDTNEKILDQLIVSNRRAFRMHVLVAVALFGAGVVVMAASLPGQNISSIFSGVAGAFTSALSALQVKEISARREKTEVLMTIKTRYQALGKPTSAASKEERKRLLHLMSQIVEKAALG